MADARKPDSPRARQIAGTLGWTVVHCGTLYIAGHNVSGDGICLQIDLPGEGPMRLRVSSSSRMNFTGERGRSSSDRAARAAGGRSANREEGRSG